MGGGRVPGALGGGMTGGAMGATSEWQPPAAPTMGTQGPQLDPAEAGEREAGSPVALSTAPTLFSPTDSIPVPSPLTPESLVRLYQSLPVDFRDPATGNIDRVSCSPCIYTNMALPRRLPCATAAQNLIQRAWRASTGRSRILALPGRYRPMIRHAFMARGLPGEMALTLSLALSCGVATRANVDRYCHDKSVAGLGLECMHFVWAYFLLRYNVEVSLAISSFRRRDRQRRTIAEIQADDVLVWDSADGHVDHIAVVSSTVSGAANQFRIGESTGSFGGPPGGYDDTGGLSISTYEFAEPDDEGSFPVRRNL